ncbi:MAG: hypothetical protein WBR33_19770 [Pseudonocardiaceae bacterium]
MITVGGTGGLLGSLWVRWPLATARMGPWLNPLRHRPIVYPFRALERFDRRAVNQALAQQSPDQQLMTEPSVA